MCSRFMLSQRLVCVCIMWINLVCFRSPLEGLSLSLVFPSNHGLMVAPEEASVHSVVNYTRLRPEQPRNVSQAQFTAQMDAF